MNNYLEETVKDGLTGMFSGNDKTLIIFGAAFFMVMLVAIVKNHLAKTNAGLNADIDTSLESEKRRNIKYKRVQRDRQTINNLDLPKEPLVCNLNAVEKAGNIVIFTGDIVKGMARTGEIIKIPLTNGTYQNIKINYVSGGNTASDDMQCHIMTTDQIDMHIIKTDGMITGEL